MRTCIHIYFFILHIYMKTVFLLFIIYISLICWYLVHTCCCMFESQQSSSRESVYYFCESGGNSRLLTALPHSPKCFINYLYVQLCMLLGINMFKLPHSHETYTSGVLAKYDTDVKTRYNKLSYDCNKLRAKLSFVPHMEWKPVCHIVIYYTVKYWSVVQRVLIQVELYRLYHDTSAFHVCVSTVRPYSSTWYSYASHRNNTIFYTNS